MPPTASLTADTDPGKINETTSHSDLTTTPLAADPPAAPPDGAAVQTAAWIFYCIAALGSAIGQIWVGIDAPPWPPEIDWWWRALIVTPFAIVIDLGGVVASAFADFRRRLGETAYGWRVLSAGAVSVAVSINLVGHYHVPYLSVVFGGMGIFAYAVWLLHAAARRRDALRAAEKLAETAPVYGLRQELREPAVTGRARQLAVDFGYSRQESLTVARQQLRGEQRHAALSMHINKLIRARHQDPILAEIAVTTLDIDAISAALTAQSDSAAWARIIGAQLTPPGTDRNAPPPRGATPPADVLRRVPRDPASYERWRQLWAELRAGPDISSSEFAARHGISTRQVQWIRSVGQSGLLDSPVPLLNRVADLAVSGRSPAGDPTNGAVPPH
ncbi:hypothetical protein [Cryptosporangium arvum]|uniref:DUF2637 domain-containing protein n=1 Tax=Cryptosporangium arvum DSM 44712 TaxID=927661 RepID=A0A010ZXM8_9ACTN|nr:hypothetical protein [Cryptosporangium arvum]EXG81977.1 hypothetical protein CryarDRAFT_3104 [Cryptosporangium arvum DSM 44712]